LHDRLADTGGVNGIDLNGPTQTIEFRNRFAPVVFESSVCMVAVFCGGLVE
jgi:hypothetical protein